MAINYYLNYSWVKLIFTILVVILVKIETNAQESPFYCDYNAYLFQYNDVYAVDLASGNSYPVATDITTGNINGAGYNPKDGYIWGALSKPNGGIVRIGSNFSVTTHIIDQLPPNNPYIGDISSSGIYHLKPGGTTFYKIDLNPSSSTYLEMIGTETLSKDINIHDWAFNAVDGQLYTVEKSTNHLLKITPSTGTVTDIGEVPILAGLNYTYGAVYFDASGNFYVSANQTGTIYIIYGAQNSSAGNINSNIFAYGPSSSLNDGARCPTATVPQESCSNGIDDDGDGLVDCEDPSCSGVNSCPVIETSGGNDGGLESNKRLSNLIKKRNFSRVKNNYRFDQKTAKPFKGPENQDRASIEKTTTIALGNLIPQEIINDATAYESSPTDLLTITNATDVFSVDYFRGDLRVGAMLALKTEDKVYEHSKYICDRLLGAELIAVSTIEVNDQPFIRSIIKRPDGKTEFVISFSARVTDEGFVVESHWNIDKYTPDTGYYNFQIWTNTLDDLYNLSTEVFRLLEQHKPIISYQNAPPPSVFVRKARYNQGYLSLDIVNLNNTNQIQIGGGLRSTETSEDETFQAEAYLGENGAQLTLETGPIFDMGIRIDSKTIQTPDDLFVSDGPWGLDQAAPSTIVDRFEITQNANRYTGNGFPVERNIYLKGSTDEYISVYRAFTPRFTSIDLSAFNTLSFQAEGTGTLEVTLIKESINQWDNQYRTAIPLTDEMKTYKLHDIQFQSVLESPLDLSDVRMIVFTLSNTEGTDNQKELTLTDLEFSNQTYSFNTSIFEKNHSYIAPNPVIEQAKIFFAAEHTSTYDFTVVDQRGAVVQQLQGNSVKGVNQIDFQRAGLVSGIYFYTIITDQYEFYSGKIAVAE